MADPFALNEDGTAKDPAAFQKALREDPAKLEALEKEPEVAAIVLGEDINAFQELIKNVFQAEKKRLEKASRGMAERTVDAQRVDTVQLYKQLYDSGLQYGPSFRLLRNVHVPESVFNQPAEASK
ncbi:hypothetical protein N2152v2_000225 [Parachlorella kessleri]